MDRVRVWTFLSVKGGTGKSALAVTCARILSQSGRTPLLIDADLTGTSLADGLGLLAPRLEGDTLNLRPEYDPERMTLQESKAGRAVRACGFGIRPSHVPYLNDALLFQATSHADECRLPAMAWRSPNDTVQYLPASPLRCDQRIMQQFMDRKNRPCWGNRFYSLLELSLIQMPDLTDIVIDTPPGLFGFGEETIRVLQDIHCKETVAFPQRKWEARPFLIMTPDRNDFIRGMDEFLDRIGVPRLIPVINKSVSQRAVRDQVVKELGEKSHTPHLGQILRFVRNHDYLSQMFSGGGSAKLTPQLEKQIATSLEIWET